MKYSKYKKNFYLSLIVISLFSGNISCASRNKLKNNSKFYEEVESLPRIKAVAALGQLSPKGETRKLASPITQFGTFPRVKVILVKVGDFVKAGDTLAIFENKEQLEVDLKKKLQLLSTNEEEISLKKDQIKRYELATDAKAYSYINLMQRKDELLKLRKQKIKNLGDKKKIEIDLINSELISPIDGFILSIKTREGERATNEGILEVGASQNMEALIEVYESDINRVFKNQDVEIVSENGGFKEKIFGKVARISPQVKQRKVLSTDPTGDADARIIEVLVKLDSKSVELVKNFAGMKVIAIFNPK